MALLVELGQLVGDTGNLNPVQTAIFLGQGTGSHLKNQGFLFHHAPSLHRIFPKSIP